MYLNKQIGLLLLVLFNQALNVSIADLYVTLFSLAMCVKYYQFRLMLCTEEMVWNFEISDNDLFLWGFF